jgi:signal transduction histidine kinase
VERGIEHLNKLVVDVTQFSRQRPLTLTPVKLEDLLDVSLLLVEDRVQDKEINVVRDYGEPVQGYWDDDQLTQVFVNLLANGIEASPAGATVTLTFKNIGHTRMAARPHHAAPAPPADANTEFVRVIVQDTGSGMDAKTKGRIFEPFFTTKKRGTGLGLAVVKQIVELHGGGIAVESEVGKGTQFIVELPVRAQGAVGAAIETSPAEAQAEAQPEAIDANP